mmetsp:Transcript_55434/g.104081  ORF Transcript_55434/g.104081 Transcript_55434/m.104081 type:complete len:91 (-) Transcript_55434:1-273(-)
MPILFRCQMRSSDSEPEEPAGLLDGVGTKCLPAGGNPVADTTSQPPRDALPVSCDRLGSKVVREASLMLCNRRLRRGTACFLGATYEPNT